MFRSLRSIGLVLSAIFCLSGAALASSTATIVVGGAETQNFDQSWDVGPIQLSFNGFTETITYGQYSSAASVASSIAGQFTRDYAHSGLCVHASGSTVTFILSGSTTFGILSTSGTTKSFYLSTAGFAAAPITSSNPSGNNVTSSTVNMTGGWDAGTFYDSGTLMVQVSGATAQIEWVEGSTPASLASTLASAIDSAAGGFVSAGASGGTVTVTSLNDGPAVDMSITGSTSDSNAAYFNSPSFTVATQSMSGGAYSAGSPLYSFSIPDQGGYDKNGNLVTATDSVMGQWNYSYDNLNRLVTATAPVSQPTGVFAQYAAVQTNWTYDGFGNRLTEQQGALPGYTPQISMPTSSTSTYTPGINQLATSTLASAITYDAAGDITYDGMNYYLYDAEGRLCAVKNSSNAMTGYIYDASGIRVAKGSLTSFTCNFASNGYATTTSWVLGPGGEQVTEYSVSSGASTWQHTNAFASGALLATYHDTDTYFALSDWLGTKRFEISAGGSTAYYRSLAYGNGLTSSGTAVDATEHHFTGKERDAESGNDYFGARYYASTMGRFMSPDWSAKYEPVPYAKLDNPQTLNLYSYVQNNPLSNRDLDGHESDADKDKKLPKPDAQHDHTVTVRQVEGQNGNPFGHATVQVDGGKEVGYGPKTDMTKKEIVENKAVPGQVEPRADGVKTLDAVTIHVTADQAKAAQQTIDDVTKNPGSYVLRGSDVNNCATFDQRVVNAAGGNAPHDTTPGGIVGDIRNQQYKDNSVQTPTPH